MEVHVRKSNRKSGAVPSWQGGRMPLSSQMSAMIRYKLAEVVEGRASDEEMKFLKPFSNLRTMDLIKVTLLRIVLLLIKQLI